MSGDTRSSDRDSWLHKVNAAYYRCVSYHGNCKPGRFSPSALRLINCETKKVESPDSYFNAFSVRYAALSYFWVDPPPARANIINENTAPLRLMPAVIPRAIEEAMKLTIKLSLKYLYVDRYCSVEHLALIRPYYYGDLESIFRRAEFTIIPAMMTNPHNGLGLLPDTLDDASTGIPPPKCLVPFSLIQNTTWAKDAWKYQEAMFSKRLLVILDGCVFFQCNTLGCYIDNSMPLSAGVVENTANVSEFNPTFHRDVEGTAYGTAMFPWDMHGKHGTDIYSLISTFSTQSVRPERNLRTSIYRTMDKFMFKKPATFSFWGIPFIPEFDLTVSFLYGMLWARFSLARVVTHHPTWSWQAWISYMSEPIFHHRPDAMVVRMSNVLHDMVPQIWLHVASNNERRSLAWLTMMLRRGTHMEKTLMGSLHVRGWCITLKISKDPPGMIYYDQGATRIEISPTFVQVNLTLVAGSEVVGLYTGIPTVLNTLLLVNTGMAHLRIGVINLFGVDMSGKSLEYTKELVGNMKASGLLTETEVILS